MPPDVWSLPTLYVQTWRSCDTLAGVIWVRGECRVPIASRLYMGQSPTAAGPCLPCACSAAPRTTAAERRAHRMRIRRILYEGQRVKAYGRRAVQGIGPDP